MPAESGAGELEPAQVRSMFDGIAPIYDALNTAMTAGLHHRWRERAADEAQVEPGSRVLDVATGTGDLAFELARRVSPGGEVVGSDFSEAMLALARDKAARGRAVRGRTAHSEAAYGEAARNGGSGVEPRFEWGDALELPYDDDSFDAATVGFGVRNFGDLGRGLAEMVRVVRPGGRVVILEFTTPTKPPLSWFYGLWFDRIVPVLGRMSPNPAAYSYLPNSVKRFPAPAGLAAAMDAAGLDRIRYLLTAGGIVTIHVGAVPDAGLASSTRPREAQRATGEARGATGEAERVTGEARGATGEAERVPGAARGVPGAAQRATGAARGATGEAQRVTGESQPEESQ